MRNFANKQPDAYGLPLMLEFGHRFLRPFTVKGRSPREVVEDAAFCISFLKHWRQAVLGAPHLSLKRNFLTHETETDALIACNNAIMLMLGMHDLCTKLQRTVKVGWLSHALVCVLLAVTQQPHPTTQHRLNRSNSPTDLTAQPFSTPSVWPNLNHTYLF
jgi:hypothetical protein